MSLKLNPDGDVDIVRINDNLINIKMVTKIKLRDNIIGITMANDEELRFYNKDADTTIGELLTDADFDELYEFIDIRISYIEIV